MAGQGKKKDIRSALDCSPIKNADDAKCFLDFAQKFSEENIFALSKNEKFGLKLSDAPFAYINYKDSDRRVWTGRWIGQATFVSSIDKKPVTLEITPRFGNLSIFSMIEESFSCNIVSSRGKHQSSADKQSLMDLLIPFIWAHKLSQANQYGVPHNNVERIYKGPAIKGHLDVRKSIIPLFREHQVVSIKREKQIDEPIAQIITQAHKKLSAKIKTRLTPNAENALDGFYSMRFPQRFVSESEYRKIHYKPIYYSFKDIVDFSWQIIKARKQAETDGNNESFSGFLDMAEIWEIFLRSVLRNNFSKLGWSIGSPSIDVYENTFWKRKIIPDIVMEKGDDVVIFDAKWKKMDAMAGNVEHSDLDRSDFFQIHSYISYYKAQGKNVVLAGLLYPLGENFPIGPGATECSLWGLNEQTKFIVDGIRFKNQEKVKQEKNISNDEDLYLAYKEEVKHNVKEFVDHLQDVLEERMVYFEKTTL